MVWNGLDIRCSSGGKWSYLKNCRKLFMGRPSVRAMIRAYALRLSLASHSAWRASAAM
jgi:hypothetical protein